MTTKKRRWTDELVRLNASEEMVKWCKGYDSLSDAWEACTRGDWMLRLLGKLSGKSGSLAHKKLVRVTCECARLALPYAGEAKNISQKTLETAEDWAKGKQCLALYDVRKAADAIARTAIATHESVAVYYAVLTSYYAIITVTDPNSASRAVGCASYAAVRAAVHAAGDSAKAIASADSARSDIFRQCADIVRKHYELPTLIR